ncbi:hypothetical protein FRC11_007124 [Ceratobasidium sp. 423]|nr:hypothetical protein FRC11_007124 [Ceratobasidium sp. 423]
MKLNHIDRMGTVEKAIQYKASVASFISETKESVDLPLRLEQLGQLRFSELSLRRPNELENIENGIACIMTRSLFLTAENDCPARHWRLGFLGDMHTKRFQRLGDLEDLQKAGVYTIRTLPVAWFGGHTFGGHPDLPRMLTQLGIVYELKFMRLDGLEDIEKAVGTTFQAVSLTPDHHPALSGRLYELGIAHDTRFQHLDELDDLEKAITYKNRAVLSMPEDHPRLATHPENLGTLHAIRFQHLGNLDDIEKVVSYKTRGLSIVSEDDPELPRYLENLGTSHRARFQFALTPDDYLGLPKTLENLGRSHETRFSRTEDPDDSEKALTYKTRALLLTPEGHPDLPKHLENLGRSHFSRFWCLGKLEIRKGGRIYGANAFVDPR